MVISYIANTFSALALMALEIRTASSIKKLKFLQKLKLALNNNVSDFTK